MVAVCVPWRPGDQHRNANWEYVRAFWSDFPVFTGDTDGPFNRAAARKAAAAQTDADVLIFADADTIGDHAAIRQAVDHAAATGKLTYPHTRTVKLTRPGTELVERVMPDLLVIGMDWLTKDYLRQVDLTAGWLQAHGVSLVYVPYTDGISTSEIIARSLRAG